MASKINSKNLSLIVGVVFTLIILTLIIFVPCPSNPQYTIFRIVISVAIAGVAAVLPGAFQLNISDSIKSVGALAIFGFVYMYDPAKLNSSGECDQFQLTVFVHGGKGVHDRVITGKGEVVVNLRNDPRKESIGNNGEVHFNEIPTTFKGTKVTIGLLNVPPFEVAFPDSAYELNGEPIYLKVKAEGLDEINGFVYNERREGVEGAIIRVMGISVESSSDGSFKLIIPEKYHAREQEVTVHKEGYEIWNGTATPETKQVLHAYLTKLK